MSYQTTTRNGQPADFYVLNPSSHTTVPALTPIRVDHETWDLGRVVLLQDVGDISAGTAGIMARNDYYPKP